MKKIVLFGQGEFAELCHYYLTHNSDNEVVAFTVDSAFIKESRFCGCPVIPFEECDRHFAPENVNMFIAIGYSGLNVHRQAKYEMAKARGYRLVSYVHPSSRVPADLCLGDNCFVMENNTLQPFASIGSNVIIWCNNLISHNVRLGDHSFISSGVILSGGVSVGERSFIGVNVTVGDGVAIGDDCVIGAGSLILKDAPAGRAFVETATEMAPLPSSRLVALL